MTKCGLFMKRWFVLLLQDGMFHRYLFSPFALWYTFNSEVSLLTTGDWDRDLDDLFIDDSELLKITYYQLGGSGSGF